jgi:hypothetical protein
VAASNRKPDQVMNALKAYSSRALNHLAFDQPDRHGSTRYLWTRESVSEAIHYVVREQGDASCIEVARRSLKARRSVACLRASS